MGVAARATARPVVMVVRGWIKLLELVIPAPRRLPAPAPKSARTPNHEGETNQRHEAVTQHFEVGRSSFDRAHR